MNQKKIRALGTGVLVAVWACLTLGSWLLPDQDFSQSERRELTQLPAFTAESLGNGRFMADFEDYGLDQFPLRDTFRKIKALFHYNALGQKDNNGIYIAQGYAVQQEYPLNDESIDYAVKRFDHVYRKYLADSQCRAYFALVPDKGCYLAEDSHQLAMDYAAIFRRFREELPWAEQIDLTGTLTADSYYRTDTHWRQEKLFDAAGAICEAMGVSAPDSQTYAVTPVERPFYGVYYGQAALPMDPETMYLLESETLSGCATYVGEWDQKNGPVFRKLYDGVYDGEKLAGKDMYEGYLSGSQSLLRIENPNAATDRELVIFRDSFGSSIAPLLVDSYAAVTLVDIRYLSPEVLGWFLTFDSQDVLFLYSTLVLNNSTTLK